MADETRHCPTCGAPGYADHCFNCGFYVADETVRHPDADGLTEAERERGLTNENGYLLFGEIAVERIVAERVQAERAAWVSKIEALAEDYFEDEAGAHVVYVWQLRALLPADDTEGT